MELQFYKYQGTGNDFVIIDENDLKIDLSTTQIKKICDRRFGIGADGLMIFKLNDDCDFKMLYYNSDGRESSMCGNGGRCLTKFAYEQKFKDKEHFSFIAIDGIHEAIIETNDIVKLKMNDVSSVAHRQGYHILNTGSPHYVKHVNDVMGMNVKEQGAAIRYNDTFKDDGINVNFVEQLSDSDTIIVRTYERGVEDETLSCGTGVTASALMYAHNDHGFNNVNVKTLGGNLSVEFDNNNNVSFENIWLCGPAKMVFKGSIYM